MFKNPEGCHTRTNEDMTIDAKLLFKMKKRDQFSPAGIAPKRRVLLWEKAA
jgi:hypothetical protein